MQIEVNTRVSKARVRATVATDSVAAHHYYRHFTDLQFVESARVNTSHIDEEAANSSPYLAAIYQAVDAWAPKELATPWSPNPPGLEHSKMERS